MPYPSHLCQLFYTDHGNLPIYLATPWYLFLPIMLNKLVQLSMLSCLAAPFLQSKGGYILHCFSHLSNSHHKVLYDSTVCRVHTNFSFQNSNILCTQNYQKFYVQLWSEYLCKIKLNILDLCFIIFNIGTCMWAKWN